MKLPHPEGNARHEASRLLSLRNRLRGLFSGAVACIALAMAGAPICAGAEPLKIALLAPSDHGQQHAFAIMQRVVLERTGLTLQQAETASLTLGYRADIGTDGFAIESAPNGTTRILGNNLSGLLAGIGKYLRNSRLGQNTFEPGTWRGVSVPKCPVRGVYFATHFFNWYHQAPIEDVRHYIEDLSLWGCNTLAVWFDMHHFDSIDSPAAQAMLQRLRILLKAGQDAGLKPALTFLSNEAFASSPKSLRAEWNLKNGYDKRLSHYHVEACPNKPGGMDYILKTRREVFEAFKGIDFKYLISWPYDQGGCTCSQCNPWGANGFVKTSAELAAMARKMYPAAQLILSTWYFDNYFHGSPSEWSLFDKAVSSSPSKWIDFLMVDDAGNKFPDYPIAHDIGGIPMINFPEISMYENLSWGGYGANPSPLRMRGMWEQTRGKLAGGYPYSEGRFEDMNKCIVLQLYWDGQDPMTTLREYMAFEFSPDSADALADVAREMEECLSHRCLAGGVIGKLKQKDKASVQRLLYPEKEEEGLVLFQTPKLGAAELRMERVTAAEKRLSPLAAKSWRWRVFFLRAAIDAELKRTGGKHSALLDSCFGELETLYCAQNAIGSVRPPSRPAMIKLYAKP